MPLARLDNFLKNLNGNTLYVDPNELDSTDSIDNRGNSRSRPFKTIQRALLEASRFSYIPGTNNDLFDQTTILISPAIHYIDNRPGYYIDSDKTTIKDINGNIKTITEFSVRSNFDITDPFNDLYIYNSVNGGVIVPKGVSIVASDLRKTKIRPKFVPSPSNPNILNSAIFRVTGSSYIFGFSIFDGDPLGTVYNTYSNSQVLPNYSHHKLTAFEYADGMNNFILSDGTDTGTTDLDMYYYKVSLAYGNLSGRSIIDGYVNLQKNPEETKIVGDLGQGSINITSLISGDGALNPSRVLTITTETDHNLSPLTSITITGVGQNQAQNVSSTYNGIYVVYQIETSKRFTVLLSQIPSVTPAPSITGAVLRILSDTVTSSSPYIFNCSLKSVYGMNGLHADGSKATGFRSMVTAQFTGISLQKDDNAFVKYNSNTSTYQDQSTFGTSLFLHQDSESRYKPEYSNYHIKCSNNAFIQCVSIFAIGYSRQFVADSGGDQSITNSNSNFGSVSLYSKGFRNYSQIKDNAGYITNIICPKDIPTTESSINCYSIDIGLTQSQASSNSNTRVYFKDYKSFFDPPSNKIRTYYIGGRSNDKIYYLNGSVEKSATISPNYILNKSISSIDVSTNTITVSDVTGISVNQPVRIISKNALLPDGIDHNKIYYVSSNGFSSTNIKISSYIDGPLLDIKNTQGLFSGNLILSSKVSDILAGNVGSPIQWDSVNSRWYISISSSSDFISGLTGLTNATFSIKRLNDNRKISDKIYKLRYFIPKEASNAADPNSGFILQRSSSDLDSSYSLPNNTDLSSTQDRLVSIRNKGIIVDAWTSLNGSIRTVTIVTSTPHKLEIGNLVEIYNLKSSGEQNPVGLGTGTGFNGAFYITSIPTALSFSYVIPRNPGNIISIDNTSTSSWMSVRNCFDVGNYRIPPYTIKESNRNNLPYFKCKSLPNDYQIYKIDTIQKYEKDASDGIYHITLNAFKNTPQISPFNVSDYKLSQSVENIYPTLDYDNINSDVDATSTIASKKIIGKVDINDTSLSVTKETLLFYLKDIGDAIKISQISVNGSTATISTPSHHPVGSIASLTDLNSGSGYVDGNYYDIPLCVSDSNQRGINATVNITVSGGVVVGLNIANPGSGYASGELLLIRGIPGSSSDTSVVLQTSSNPMSIQIIGSTNSQNNGSFPILSSSSSNISFLNSIAISENTSNAIALIFPGYIILNRSYNSSTNQTTFFTTTLHSFFVGSKVYFRRVSSGNVTSPYYINTVSANTFTVTGNLSSIIVANDIVHNYGISSNIKDSGIEGENLNTRSIPIFGGAISTINLAIDAISNNFTLSSYNNLNKGDFIQIEGEILLITRISYSGNSPTGIYVMRGLFGTQSIGHIANSIVSKISISPIELRRNSILRASGHTFEYTGFGPGNYSTGMPSSQNRVLTSDEILISQALTSSGGFVVYTGMNSNGEFYIGRKKYDSSTGEEIVVSGANSQTEFQEVTFSQNITVQKLTVNESLDASTAEVKVGTLVVESQLDSTTCSDGALTLKGGLGIQKNLNVCGNAKFDNTITGTIDKSDQISVSGLGNTAGPHYPLFSQGTSENRYTTPRVDTGISYNSETNALTAGAFIGAGTIPVGGIIMWSGTIANIPTGWALCNGQEVIGQKTPDLRNRFVVGAHSGAGTGTVETAGPGFNADNGTLSSSYTPGNSGGETAHQLTTAELASHSHTLSGNIADGGSINVGSSGHEMRSETSTTSSVGDSKFHENRPPYYALAFIMRIS